MLLQHVLLGAIFAAFGFGVIYFAHWIVNNVAPIPWAERHIASGSSYGVYRLTGLVIMIGGLLYMIGQLDNVLRFLFGWLGGSLGLE